MNKINFRQCSVYSLTYCVSYKYTVEYTSVTNTDTALYTLFSLTLYLLSTAENNIIIAGVELRFVFLVKNTEDKLNENKVLFVNVAYVLLRAIIFAACSYFIWLYDVTVTN